MPFFFYKHDRRAGILNNTKLNPISAQFKGTIRFLQYKIWICRKSLMELLIDYNNSAGTSQGSSFKTDFLACTPNQLEFVDTLMFYCVNHKKNLLKIFILKLKIRTERCLFSSILHSGVLSTSYISVLLILLKVTQRGGLLQWLSIIAVDVINRSIVWPYF